MDLDPQPSTFFMVERRRRGRGKAKLLGSHRQCWVWGRHAVEETLRAGRWPPLLLYLSDALTPNEQNAAAARAGELNVPLAVESNDRLTQRAQSSEHQGWLAKMPSYPYLDLDRLLAERPRDALLLVLDRIQDPYNFGVILRTAAALGIDGVLVDAIGQAAVTGHVVRASAGAVGHLRMAKCDDLPAGMATLKRSGLQIVGTSPDAKRPIHQNDLTGPLALIVGNEGAGIRQELATCCDALVSIPQSGTVASLNAAVAAGILLYAACLQRQTIPPCEGGSRCAV